MRDLTPRVAEHNDPSSTQHGIDKSEAARRRQTKWKPAGWDPSPAVVRRAGNRVVEGVFKSPTKGFCFLMHPAGPRIVPGPDYVSAASSRSKALRRYKRERVRDGHKRMDTGRYKSGLASIITTLPPWSMRTLEKVSESKLEFLLLALAEEQAKLGKEISGRSMFSGAVHQDTAVLHFHTDWEKVDPVTKFAHPKSNFLSAGPWLVGADRINRTFPGLLSPWEEKRLGEHLKRKDEQHLIDVQLSRRMDQVLEEWIRFEGLEREFEKEKREYREKKKKEQKARTEEKWIEAALDDFVKNGIWRLAYQTMTLAAWRMVPPELRRPIQLIIRATQVIRRPNPANMIGLGVSLVKLSQMDMAQPARIPPLR